MDAALPHLRPPSCLIAACLLPRSLRSLPPQSRRSGGGAAPHGHGCILLLASSWPGHGRILRASSVRTPRCNLLVLRVLPAALFRALKRQGGDGAHGLGRPWDEDTMQ